MAEPLPVDQLTPNNTFTLVDARPIGDDIDVPDSLADDVVNRLVVAAQYGPGIGVWLKSSADAGLVTIPIPSGRQTYPIGNYQLTLATSTDSTGAGVSVPAREWRTADGRPLPDTAPEPYHVELAWDQSDANRNGNVRLTGSVLLIPRDVENSLQVSATPLDEHGRECSPAVALRAQPVGSHLFFIRIPGGYDNRTTAFRLMVRGFGATGSWRLSGLPKSDMIATRGDISTLPYKTDGLTITATATEAADRWFSWSPPAGNQVKTAAWNADHHYASGLPTLACTIHASAPASGDAYRVELDGITPQWVAPGVRPDTSSLLPGPMTISAGGPGQTRLYTIGAVYPGQQHCVVIKGAYARMHQITEAVTFHDADLCYDSPAQRWIIEWKRFQSVNLPSGTTVSVFNRRIMRTDMSGDESPAWAAINPAELDLGIRPSRSADGGSATVSVDLPPPFSAAYTFSPVDGWRTYWVPGELAPVPHSTRHAMTDSPIYAYYHDGFVQISVAVKPAGDNHLARANPTGQIPPCPVPVHIDDLKVVIHTTVTSSPQPFTLVVPVTGAGLRTANQTPPQLN